MTQAAAAQICPEFLGMVQFPKILVLPLGSKLREYLSFKRLHNKYLK